MNHISATMHLVLLKALVQELLFAKRDNYHLETYAAWRDSPSLSKSALSSERQSQAWQKQKGYLPEQWNTQLSTFTVYATIRGEITHQILALFLDSLTSVQQYRLTQRERVLNRLTNLQQIHLNPWSFVSLPSHQLSRWALKQLVWVRRQETGS